MHKQITQCLIRILLWRKSFGYPFSTVSFGIGYSDLHFSFTFLWLLDVISSRISSDRLVGFPHFLTNSTFHFSGLLYFSCRTYSSWFVMEIRTDILIYLILCCQILLSCHSVRVSTRFHIEVLLDTIFICFSSFAYDAILCYFVQYLHRLYKCHNNIRYQAWHCVECVQPWTQCFIFFGKYLNR